MDVKFSVQTTLPGSQAGEEFPYTIDYTARLQDRELDDLRAAVTDVGQDQDTPKLRALLILARAAAQAAGKTAMAQALDAVI